MKAGFRNFGTANCLIVGTLLLIISYASLGQSFGKSYKLISLSSRPMDGNTTAAIGSDDYSIHGSGILGTLQNSAFIAALLAFALAQIAKLFTHWYAQGEFVLTRVVGSGGMPSSHTSLVIGLTTAVGVKEGTTSDLFAICLIFSLVVMYDASGVRLQAGKHASVLNMIILELPPDHPIQESRPTLKDSIGHTPLQVLVGAILGLLVGYLFQITWNAIADDQS